MKGTQEEIQAIQARLQAINGREIGYRPATAVQMVEMFPAARGSTTGGNSTVIASPSERSPSDRTPLWRSLTATVPYPSGVTSAPVAERSTSPHTEQAVLSHLDATWNQLTTQAEHINQLTSAQEAALLELRAIAQRLERDWRATGLEKFPFAENDGDFSALYRQGSAELPYIERDEEGRYLLTSRTLDLLKAEREAQMMAQELRKRRPQTMATFLTPTGQTVLRWLANFVSRRSVRPARTSRRGTPTPVAAPMQEVPLSLPNAALWLMGSTVARMAIDAVLLSHPALWLPAVGLIIAPAAIAAYRTTIAPETSLLWGYRLLLIMIGLLLGGRF